MSQGEYDFIYCDTWRHCTISEAECTLLMNARRAYIADDHPTGCSFDVITDCWDPNAQATVNTVKVGTMMLRLMTLMMALLVFQVRRTLGLLFLGRIIGCTRKGWRQTKRRIVYVTYESATDIVCRFLIHFGFS